MAAPQDDRARSRRREQNARTGTEQQGHAENDIARRAYERFRARGEEHGRDQEDWFEAERELADARRHQTE